jgi:predicted RNA-binding protein YlqC (UPF0109 family)
MKELVELLVKSLVDHPDEVNIQEIGSDRTVTIEVSVSPADIGKVIGKGGRIANALRTIVKAAAIKEDKRVYLEIVS